jgi:hypothetical protein
MDAVKSAEQLAAEKQSAAESSQPAPKSVGGLIGGLARRAVKKDEEPKTRATFLTTSNEVLKLTTDVTAGDVAVPAGFTETK